jgi:hypothetical protein
MSVVYEGQCYSCTNQGAIELKHPSGGGYEKGHKASGSYYPSDASSDEDDFEYGMWHICLYFVFYTIKIEFL